MLRPRVTWLGFIMTAGCLSDVYVSSDRSWGSSESARPEATIIAPTRGPEFGPTVRQEDPPPPISGGTLAVTPDGALAVAADPDRDAVYLVGTELLDVRTVKLERHDEPGRVALDGEERAYVSLRRGGAVVAIDLAKAEIAWRVPACSAPRGLAWDAAARAVRVVCAGGEIVTIPESGGSASVRREKALEDLRDVVVGMRDGKPMLFVSTFRTAEVVALPPDAGPMAVHLAPLPKGLGSRTVAWRMMAATAPPGGDVGGGDEPVASGEVVVVSQSAGATVVSRPAEYYAASDDGIGVGTVVSTADCAVYLTRPVLPVDIAVSPKEMAIVSVGSAHVPGESTVVLAPRPVRGCVDDFRFSPWRDIYVPGEITSVAWIHDGGRLLALSREPARLFVLDPSAAARTSSVVAFAALSDVSRADTGHAVFHANAGARTACASCHPEGRDDGHSWTSLELGRRRTPSLAGTVANTAPYHWNGEAADLRAVATLTFTSRMRGPSLRADQVQALEGWLTSVPPLVMPPPSDAAAVARGKTVFESPTARCSTCHSGAARTNNETLDIGTGGAFQVPSLVNVGLRAPYLHDGTAHSLRALLARPHGGAVLKDEEADDLVAYLKTL